MQSAGASVERKGGGRAPLLSTGVGTCILPAPGHRSSCFSGLCTWPRAYTMGPPWFSGLPSRSPVGSTLTSTGVDSNLRNTAMNKGSVLAQPYSESLVGQAATQSGRDGSAGRRSETSRRAGPEWCPLGGAVFRASGPSLPISLSKPPQVSLRKTPCEEIQGGNQGHCLISPRGTRILMMKTFSALELVRGDTGF